MIYIDLCVFVYEMNVVMFIVMQMNCDGVKVYIVKVIDVGDDWNKVCMVDIMIGINVMDVEKYVGEVCLIWLFL